MRNDRRPDLTQKISRVWQKGDSRRVAALLTSFPRWVWIRHESELVLPASLQARGAMSRAGI
jgi:hypothetical protein